MPTILDKSMVESSSGGGGEITKIFERLSPLPVNTTTAAGSFAGKRHAIICVNAIGSSGSMVVTAALTVPQIGGVDICPMTNALQSYVIHLYRLDSGKVFMWLVPIDLTFTSQRVIFGEIDPGGNEAFTLRTNSVVATTFDCKIYAE